MYVVCVYGMDIMIGIDVGDGCWFINDLILGGLYWYVYYIGSILVGWLWVFVVNEKMMYLYFQNYLYVGLSNILYWEFYWFGDYDVYFFVNIFNICIQGKVSSSLIIFEQEFFVLYNVSLGVFGFYVVRFYIGLGGFVQFGCCYDYLLFGFGNWGGNGSFSYLYGFDGVLMMFLVWIYELGGMNMVVLFGKMFGLWVLLQYVLNIGDIFQGEGDLVGKIFLVFCQYEGCVVIEILDIWS